MADNNYLDLSRLYNIATPRQIPDSYNGFPGLDNYYQEGDNNLSNNGSANSRTQTPGGPRSDAAGNQMSEISGNNASRAQMLDNGNLINNRPSQNQTTVRQENGMPSAPMQMEQNGMNTVPRDDTELEIVDFKNEDVMQSLNDLMRTQIGRNVTIQFLIGSDNLIEKRGTVLAVGDDYIILREDETGNIIVCDFYNIRFATLNY